MTFLSSTQQSLIKSGKKWPIYDNFPFWKISEVFRKTKKLADHLEFEIFFGDTRVLVESFGEEKLMLGFFPQLSAKIP